MPKEKLKTENNRIYKYCPKCKEWKDRQTEYSPKRGQNEKVHSWCKKCCVESVSEYRKRNGRCQTEMAERMQRITSAMCAYGSQLRTKDIREIYEEQKGLCYYTGIKMLLMAKTKMHPLIVSVDRKDSTRGYTRDNVVLCCYGINALKGRGTETELYENIKKIYEASKIKHGWD